MKLKKEEIAVREILIRVAKGEAIGSRVGRISYKEIWKGIGRKEKWGQGFTRQVVEWITNVSAFELKNGRPPLNELVTPTNKLIPTEPWSERINGIQRYLKRKSGGSVPYRSHEEAQEACWRYWATHAKKGRSLVKIVQSEADAEEGYRRDGSSSFLTRNRKLIEQAKERDKYTCQACNFRLKIGARFLIDCHHKNPLGGASGPRVTKLSDLVCLCPTCHRVAHTSKFPLSVEAIRTRMALRK